VKRGQGGMMFEEIKKKYPKAYKRWIQFIYAKTWGELLKIEIQDFEKFTFSLNIESLVGWLFRFFDEQEIYVDCYSCDNGNNWEYDLWYMKELYFEQKFKTRQEATKQAFAKAFEILEE